MKNYPVTALGELLIDFTENGLSNQGNFLINHQPLLIWRENYEKNKRNQMDCDPVAGCPPVFSDGLWRCESAYIPLTQYTQNPQMD